MGTAQQALGAGGAVNRGAGYNMIARFDRIDRAADCFDDTCRLVTEHRGGSRRERSMETMQIAMTNSAGDGPDQNFVSARLIDVNFFDGERLIEFTKNCSFHISYILG